MSSNTFHKVEASELKDQHATGFDVCGVPVVIVNLSGKFYALKDQCSHMRSRLSTGYVKDGQLVCPAHFGSFDIATGAATSKPCRTAVESYPIRQENGEILVGLPA